MGKVLGGEGSWREANKANDLQNKAEPTAGPLHPQDPGLYVPGLQVGDPAKSP